MKSLFTLLSILPETVVPFSELAGNSPIMQNLQCLIRDCALSDENILITGEKGTGKESVARTIHNLSKRKNFRFVPVDCIALPERKMERFLFGKDHKSKSTPESIGQFEIARGGTLYLNEIEDLGLELQNKIYRALRWWIYRRIRGQEDLDVEFKIIASSSNDLKKEVLKNTFNNDLLRMISGREVHLPPLRERMEDITDLSDFFLKRFSREIGKNIDKVHPEVVDVFEAYTWPGNIWEFQNVLKHAMVMCKNAEIRIDDLPDNLINFSKAKSDI
jgi:DNA-binding NtrC family response regulator